VTEMLSHGNNFIGQVGVEKHFAGFSVANPDALVNQKQSMSGVHPLPVVNEVGTASAFAASVEDGLSVAVGTGDGDERHTGIIAARQER
jgi:hypothetical protein